MEDNQLLQLYRRSLVHLSTSNINSTRAHIGKSLEKNKSSLYEKDKSCDLLIVIPVHKRESHLRATVECLKSQIANLENPSSVGLIVSEMDEEPLHDVFCAETETSYHFMRKVKGEFNKSVVMNSAVKYFVEGAKRIPLYVLFHDVDIVTEDGWIKSCLDNATKFDKTLPTGEGWICQTIKDRKLEYISRENTEKYFSNELSIKDLSQISHNISRRWYEQIYPPGGSIMISSLLLYASGGYDEALFWGYSPEDKHFLDICQVLAPNCFFPFESEKRSYHLYHENLELTNNSLEHMVAISGMIKADINVFCYHQALKLAAQTTFPNIDNPAFYSLLDTTGKHGYFDFYKNSFSDIDEKTFALVRYSNKPLARFILTYLSQIIPDHPLVQRIITATQKPDEK